MSSFEEDVFAPEVNFPRREFFYTIQQVCLMVDVSQKHLEERAVSYTHLTLPTNREV